MSHFLYLPFFVQYINVVPKKSAYCHAKTSQSSPDVLVEETVIGTKEESDSSETLIDETDSVDSIYHTSFILDKNTEARQTPLRKIQGKKTNNEEVTESRIKRLDFYHTKNS